MTDKIEGRNPVLEALKSGRAIEKLYVKKGSGKGSIVQIIAKARDIKIPVTETDMHKLNEMSETGAHQGVIAICAAAQYSSVDDILQNAESKGEKPFIIILDRVKDPHNLGSVIRSANCAGCHGVIITKHDSTGLTASCCKAAAGAQEYTPVAKVTNLPQTIEYLQKRGIWVTAADASGDRELYDADLTGAIAIVIGSEGEGISRLVLEKCDYTVKIPMSGNINSLNASVAAALFMYEAKRQKGGEKQ